MNSIKNMLVNYVLIIIFGSLMEVVIKVDIHLV